MISLCHKLPLALFLFLISSVASAQEIANKTAPVLPKVESKTAQQRPIEKWLPRTYAKLKAGESIRVLALGDSVIGMFGYGQDAGNALKAYPAVFLQQLADEFRLTGGVRWTNPKKKVANKLVPLDGTEILYECHAFQGKCMESAGDMLHAFNQGQSKDLVIAAFGLNDAISGVALERVSQSLRSFIHQVKQSGAELLLVGPHALITDPPELGMGLTRPYVDVIREIAQNEGVGFIDLGDLSWLVRIDHAKSPKLIPVVPSEEVLANPSPIVSPFADDLDPDDEKKAARLFAELVSDYRKYFEHESQVDWVHPTESYQRVLGRRIYSELMGQKKSIPWKVGASFVTRESSERCKLTYHLENTSDEPISLTLLPLVVPAWKPADLPTIVTIPAKESITVNAAYTKVPADYHRIDTYVSANDSFLRLPVLHSAGELVRIEDIRAVLKPINVLWQTQTQFNQENAFELLGEIQNSSKELVSGTWTAIWQGQRLKGEFRLEPNVKTPVKLKFDFPKDPAIRRLQGALGFSVEVKGITLNFDRQVELMRNLGLGDRVPLLMADISSQQSSPQEAAPKAKVWFEAKADEKALYFTWDVEGTALDENSNDQLSLVTETSLDARSYGKRLFPGAVDFIRAGCKDRDGIGAVDELSPWVFGSGYAMAYDRRAIHTELSTTQNGGRRFTMAIPRTYLYLHEWSLGNGNSQIGINTTLQLWRASLSGSSGAFLPFRLSPNPLSRGDAQSLVPLELTERPTARWTTRFY